MWAHRRRGGDSAEERERVPLRIRAGREEGRGDDLWAGAHHDGHRENSPKSLHHSNSALASWVATVALREWSLRAFCLLSTLRRTTDVVRTG